MSFSVLAQSPWIPQLAPGLLNSGDRAVVFVAVDDNVCWGKNNINSQFLRTTDGGTNWTVSTVTGASGLRCSGITAIDADTAWIAMNDPSGVTSGGIFKTTDGGNTWTLQTAFTGSGGHPIVIHFFDANNGLCVGNPRNNEFKIYTTTNGGTNWNLVDGANIPNPLNGELGIEHTIVNSAGNSYWFQTFSNRLYRTTDHGYTWSVADSVTGGPNQLGFSFAFKDDLNGLAIDFYPQTAFSRSSDGGATWVPVNPIPPGLDPDSMSLRFIIYVKGTNGSYVITSPINIGGNQSVPGTAYSNNDGVTWTQNSILSCGPAVFSDWNTGWCTSPEINDSVYKWVSDVLPVEQENNSSLTEGFTLEQNYPNPFNPSTTIKYSIPNSEFVTLKVYDVLGNEVATLVNEEKPAGSYEIDFNAAKLSSGIYFYALQAGSYSQTKKLILMR